jgi:hypothetical protein
MRRTLGRLAWFAALWGLGVGTVAIVGFAIRAALS